MFTKAYTLLSEDTWEQAPNTNNPVESINRQSIPERGNSLEPLLENIYREDRVHAAKVIGASMNVSLSYRDNSDEARGRRNDKRKRKRYSRSDDGKEFSFHTGTMCIREECTFEMPVITPNHYLFQEHT